jgi:hypothetical protein
MNKRVVDNIDENSCSPISTDAKHTNTTNESLYIIYLDHHICSSLSDNYSYIGTRWICDNKEDAVFICEFFNDKLTNDHDKWYPILGMGCVCNMYKYKQVNLKDLIKYVFSSLHPRDLILHKIKSNNEYNNTREHLIHINVYDEICNLEGQFMQHEYVL